MAPGYSIAVSLCDIGRTLLYGRELGTRSFNIVFESDHCVSLDISKSLGEVTIVGNAPSVRSAKRALDRWAKREDKQRAENETQGVRLKTAFYQEGGYRLF